MYHIIKYKTLSGGGIAFCPYEMTSAQSMEFVINAIYHQHPVEEARHIGFCKTLDTSYLKVVKKYEVFNEDTLEYTEYELPHPIYYFGGDCC